MIVERARVIEPFAGGAWVATEAQAGCARCAAGKGCGSATLGRLVGDRLRRVAVSSDHALEVDQRVEVGIDERVLTLAAAAVYGPPLVLLLAGAALGAPSGDAAAALGALAGLALGIGLARRIASGLAPRSLRPRVLRALDADAACGAATRFGSTPTIE